MRSPAKKPKTEWPKLSGPHICAGVGKQTLDLARKGLLSAADMRGGHLTRDDITLVFDFLAEAPELFDLFRSNYEACGKIHRKQAFVGANKDFFAVSVLRFLCFDVLRRVFDPQIQRSGPDWEIEFLHGFSAYISQVADPEFEDKLSAAYRRLAKQNGNEITAITIAHDAAIQALIRDIAKLFPADQTAYVNFSNAVNKALSEKFEDYGPSPIKISEPPTERFFKALRNTTRSNYFRKVMLG
ncbi:hypothetical protein E1180_07870 [Roseibium denhamense]|uniref:Uncharacterized protein n=1 Tax=Roseibium denhamense TaxID=76305 RepID=A0ABY1NW84_9HYPH|nr:hypothetical protein [Roseibium denhamense]MTI05432.1 hypothetical protein [Roseibium denhamense]SMP18678.1 hypothetical protein SAMN06265374_1948 [Roseibium denhamense]